jgi:hypothetical protein
MPSQSPLCPCFANALRYRADVHARAQQFNSTVYHRWTIHHYVSLQNHRAKNVMLWFQMTLMGSSCKAGAANLTVDATTLPVGGCSSLRFVLGILLLCVTLSYPARNAYHCFCFGSVRKQTDPFKQSDEDVEGFLQPDWVPRGNQPIVNVKRPQNFSRSPSPLQAASSSSIWWSHSLTTASTHTLNMREESGPPCVTPLPVQNGSP